MSRLLVQASLNLLLASSVVHAAIDPDEGIIHTYASLGESFASGPSAGDLVDTQYSACRRYSQAFGPQFNADPDITPTTPKLDFIACSGSKLANIFKDPSKKVSGKPDKSQANQLDGSDPDVTTLSIGGNDVGFVNLLDHCVYRFYDIFCNGCGFFNRDCSDDCQKTIDETQATINASPLSTDLDKAISEIFKHAPKTHLYLTLYPHFFNSGTDQCEKVQFNVGCAGYVNDGARSSILPLTKDRRQKMNELTDSLNDKIKDAVNRAQPPDGGTIDFVDTNPKFDGHRFCEDGVDEPSYRNDKIYFYPEEFTTGGTVAYLQDHQNGTKCADILNDDEGGDWGDYYACELAESVHTQASNHTTANSLPFLRGNSSNVDTTSSSSLPDFLARIFHPTIKGHTAYKEAIKDKWLDYKRTIDAPPTPCGGSSCQNGPPDGS